MLDQKEYSWLSINQPSIVKPEEDDKNLEIEQNYSFYNKKPKNIILQNFNILNINRPVDASFEAKDQQVLVIRSGEY